MIKLFPQNGLLIALILALASSTGIAQTTQKGQFLAGGSIGFASISSDDAPSSTVIQLAPGVGIMATDRLGLGADLLYVRESSDNITYTAYGFSPFIRYYIYKGLFPQFQYTWLNIKEKGGFFDDSRSDSGYEISVGYTSFLSPSVALEPSVFYMSFDDENIIGLRVAFRIFLGGGE